MKDKFFSYIFASSKKKGFEMKLFGVKFIERVKASERLALAFVLLLASLQPLAANAQGLSFASDDENSFYSRVRTDAPAQASSVSSLCEYRKVLSLRDCCNSNFILAVKTNLLYDVVSAFSVEVEVPIYDRYSMMVEDIFPWWETGFKFCQQIWEMGPELRFWLQPWNPKGDDKLRGFFAGVYGMTAKYDIQFNTNIDYQGELWSAGLTFGYSKRIQWLFGKPSNTRLEFSISAGYLQTDFRHYLPTDYYDRLIRDKYNTGVVSYIGPTKAKISFVVPFYINTRRK